MNWVLDVNCLVQGRESCESSEPKSTSEEGRTVRTKKELKVLGCVRTKKRNHQRESQIKQLRRSRGCLCLLFL